MSATIQSIAAASAPQSVLPLRKYQAKPTRPRRCRYCGDVMATFEGERYCLSCTLFRPLPPTPRVQITLCDAAPDDLLQAMHDHGWDVHLRMDLDHVLFHPAVRTAADARRVLAEQGFNLGLFGLEA